MRRPTFANLFLKITPYWFFRDIRTDLIEIYVSIYNNYPEVQEHYSQYSISELREKVQDKAAEAQQYDPAEGFSELKEFVDSIYKFTFKWVLVFFAIGQLSGIEFLSRLSRTSVIVFDSIAGLLISLLLGGYWFVSTAVFLIMAFPYLMKFSTVYIQGISKELAVRGEAWQTRETPVIVSYLLWNESLKGPTALRLLILFGFLRIVSLTPRWDPYEYILEETKENADTFVNERGWWNRSKKIFLSFIRKRR